MVNINLDEYELENLRTVLAKNKKLILLNKFYSRNLPAIENKNTSNLWDKLNFNYHFLEEIKSINPMQWDRIKTVNGWVKSNSKVLDLGFGSGILEDYFLIKKKKISIEGLDISLKSVNKANNKFKNWSFKVGLAEKLPYMDQKFDYVISLEVLEHIVPGKTLYVLKEINRVLIDKGIFIISVPLNEDLNCMVKKNINYNAHVRIYTSELIKAELSLAGFKILKSKELFAFSHNYNIKTLIIKLLFFRIKYSNNILILSQKI